MTELVVHQMDPARPAIGGVDGYIRDMIDHAPKSADFALLGTADPSTDIELGKWIDFKIGERSVPFMALARLDRQGRRTLPHSALLVAGLVRHRPSLRATRIHAHRVEIGFAAAALYPRAPLVQFVHGSGRESLRHGQETYWRLFPSAYHAIERLVVARAEHSVVMHGGAAHRLRRHSPTVIHGRNWFDGTVFYPNGEVRSPMSVGWIGRFEVGKDPLLAVRVFSVLACRSDSFRAWMAGSGSLVPAVREQIRKNGLEGAVELTGDLPSSRLASRLRQSGALLITSRWEGMPRAALEALACGTPVVGTATGDLPDLIAASNGRLVPSGDPVELADRIEEVRSLGSGVAESVREYELGTVLPDLYCALRL